MTAIIICGRSGAAFAAEIAAWGHVARRIRTMVHVSLDSVDTHGGTR